MQIIILYLNFILNYFVKIWKRKEFFSLSVTFTESGDQFLVITGEEMNVSTLETGRRCREDDEEIQYFLFSCCFRKRWKLFPARNYFLYKIKTYANRNMFWWKIYYRARVNNLNVIILFYWFYWISHLGSRLRKSRRKWAVT